MSWVEARLDGANFQEARLRKANFHGAKLRKATLFSTDLRDACLTACPEERAPLARERRNWPGSFPLGTVTRTEARQAPGVELGNSVRRTSSTRS